MTPLYSLIRCKQCLSGWAVAGGPNKAYYFPIDALDDCQYTVSANVLLCPACGGDVAVLAENAMKSRSGRWVRVPFGSLQ